MGIHDHHRERLRNSFLISGFKGKTEHQVLELLLTYIIPRIDVNPIAHELIDRFGTLAGVFDADVEDLTKTKYITENGAVLLKMIPELSAIYAESKYENKILLNTYEKIKAYMAPKLAHEKNEVFYALCLDTHLNLIRAILHCEGEINHASIHPRNLINEILKTNACYVVLVHNHLSGSTVPSLEDFDATKKISEILKPLGINVVDHLIFSGKNCFNLNSFNCVLEELKQEKILN